MQEFDDIYNKEITKRFHHDHELKRLSTKRKNTKRERSIGAVGRPFRLGIKNRFMMLLVYYCLYITYTLNRFLYCITKDYANILFQQTVVKEPGILHHCNPANS